MIGNMKNNVKRMLEKMAKKIQPAEGNSSDSLWHRAGIVQWKSAAGLGLAFSNEAIGNHSGTMTAIAATEIPAKFLLVNFAADESQRRVAVASEKDRCFGVSLDEALPGDPIAIQFLGGDRTMKMTAATAICRGSFVFLAKDGKVQERPTRAGTYQRVGLALTSAAAGNLLEVLSCLPIETVVA